MSSVTYAYFALAVFICVFVFTFLYSVYPYLTRSKVPMIRTPFSKKDVLKTVLVLGSGNFLEWYDFATFGIFAAEIGKHFFPPSDPQTQLIQSWSVFAGAFLVRPLGGVLFGHVGDVHGREKALLFTILVMATPTLGIGLLPGYDSIGIAAPVVLIILRLLQGLAAGGELPGALIFAVESAPAKQRGLFGSLVQASSAGSLLSSAVAATLYYTLGAEAVDSWAWRVPFVLGAGIAIYVFCLRRSFMPTPIWLEAQPPPPPPEIELDAQSNAPSAPKVTSIDAWRHRHRHRHRRPREQSCCRESPLLRAIRLEGCAVLRIMCASALGSVGYYALFVWIPSHLAESGKLRPGWALELNMFLLLWWAGFVILGGWLADVTPTQLMCAQTRGRGCGCGRRLCYPSLGGLTLVCVAGASAVALLAPALFWTLALPSASPIITAMLLALTVGAHGVFTGPLQAWFVLSLRSVNSRYSALGLAYNTSAALFGGTVPLVATAISASDLGPGGVGAYLAAAALVSACTVTFSERFKPLEAGEPPLLREQAHVAVDMGSIEGVIIDDDYNIQKEPPPPAAAAAVVTPSVTLPGPPPP